MTDLLVNFDGLATIAMDIQSSAGRIETRLAQLDSDLRPLRSAWTGDAALAYERGRAEWTQAISDMKSMLSEVGRAVDHAQHEYLRTERRNQARW